VSAQATPAATQPFVDNFDGPAGFPPDPLKWVDYGPKCGAYAGWGKIRCGTTERLDGKGHLVIPATPKAGAGLQTKGRYGFVYGTMSVWMKLPPQPGYWAAFWSLNGDQHGDESVTGEIDISEVYTGLPGTHANAHVWDGSEQVWDTPLFATAKNLDLTKRFHKYSVTITPGRMIFLLDDVPVRVVQKSPRTIWAWGPDVMRPNFMILNLAIRRPPGPRAKKPAALLVDKVQVVPAASR
jgi:hypothetical protein